MLVSQGRRRVMTIGAALLLAVSALPAAAIAATTAPSHTLAPNTRFFVPPPQKGVVQQVSTLLRARDRKDAYLIGRMVGTPQAVWFTSGTPAEVQKAVARTMAQARGQRAVPVLVAYDIPGRDCAQYSAGGALDLASYKAWIDGFARGIGRAKAVVIVEPDSLGLLPSNCGGPNPTYPFTDADRYAELNYAVDALEALPQTVVYLDATNSAWLGVGDIAQRLVGAGVQRSQGFFLNVSNYQYSVNTTFYGTWISDCITYATAVNPGDYGSCGNQYWNGGPATSWSGTGMSTYQVWKDETYSGDPADLSWNTTGIDSRYATQLGTTAATTHFVVDTSRNGQGPWAYPAGAYADPQDWCNPPDRGLGLRPTASTGVPLLDAYLWVKIPGASDGSCTRGSAGPEDPARGVVDPAAGAWFPDMALELVHNANPAIPIPTSLK